MLLGLDVRRDAASNARAASAEHGSASDRRTPRPWTFFGVAAGLLACRSSSHPVFPMRGRISDLTIGSNSLLTVAGAAPDSRRLTPRYTGFPLSYQILRSWQTVTATCGVIRLRVSMGSRDLCPQFQKIFTKPAGAGAAGPDSAVGWKRFSPISQVTHSPVTSWRRAQSGIASRRFAAPGRSGERRAARNPGARRPCSPSRSALHSRS